MARTIADIAKELGITPGRIHEKMRMSGFPMSARTTSVGDATANKIIELFGGTPKKAGATNIRNVRTPGQAPTPARGTGGAFQQRKKRGGRGRGNKNPQFPPRKPREQTIKLKEEVALPPTLSVRDFTDILGGTLQIIMGELIKNGIMASANQMLDFDTMSVIANDLGVKVKEDIDATNVAARGEDTFDVIEKIINEEDPTKQIQRPPVISVMGHVDHGKTSILDYLRKSNVASGEAGGITQHIGAYQITHKYENKDRKITFLDTPGHAAFTAMRARGAKATDVAILVVAADDGVMPQTEEAVQHARDAGIPMVIAINKCDLESANPEKVKQDLLRINVQTEDMGGEVPSVEVSAKTGENIDKLLDLVILAADMRELKATPDKKALGIVIEAHKNPKLGNSATILVKTGTLHKNEIFTCGASAGRTRIMKDWNGKNTAAADPSYPVLVAGFAELPETGDILEVMDNEQEARARATKVLQARNARSMEERRISLSDVSALIAKGKTSVFKIIIKTDVAGTLEALRTSIEKIHSDKASVQIVAATVGDVNDSDVVLASASKSTIFAFNSKILPAAKHAALKEGVTIEEYSVIYKLVEDIEAVITGMTSEKKVKVEIGRMKVLGVFHTKLPKQTIGGEVIAGEIRKTCTLRAMRDEKEIAKGKITSLQKDKREVDLAGDGSLCGMQISIDGHAIAEGDEIVFFEEN